MVDLQGKGFGTRAVHGAGSPDPATGAVVPPISLATTFRQEAVGKHAGYEYARSGNPTRTALETHLAALESASHGFAFASGLAAEDALLRLLAPGDHVLLPNDAYGGTIRLALQVHAPAGLAVDTVDLTDLAAVREAWTPATRMVWIETPSNPWLRIVDIEALSGIAHEHGAVVGGRQHLRHPGPAAPAGPGGRRRGALHHQVPRWSQRCGRRLRRDRRRRARRADRLPPERRRRRPWSARLLPRPPRRPNAAAAHGPPQRQRHDHRRAPRGPHRRSPRSSIPGFRRTPVTTWRPARCRPSAG